MFPAVIVTAFVLPACETTTAPGSEQGRRVVLNVPDTMGVREEIVVSAIVTDLAGIPIADAEVNLLSTAPSIASLAAGGRLTGHTEGSVRIIATSGTFADTADVEVALSLLFAKELIAAGYPELFTMTRHGTALRNLTEYEYTDMDGAWSPDRKHIAFWSSRTASGVILLMNDDGSNVREITTGLAAAYDAAWSPDGTKIAFAGRHDGAADDIYVIGVDGSGLTPLTTNTAHERNPAWSPNGTRIAFERVVGSTDIHVMNADGSGVLRLTTSLTTEMAPVWSPDGQRIAFTGDITPGTGYGIHVMDADGSNLTRVGNHATNVIQFDWSPEGDWFAYAAQVDGQWDLFLMPTSGGDPVRLTNDPQVEQDVKWR
jgi:TolB protein